MYIYKVHPYRISTFCIGSKYDNLDIFILTIILVKNQCLILNFGGIIFGYSVHIPDQCLIFGGIKFGYLQQITPTLIKTTL